MPGSFEAVGTLVIAVLMAGAGAGGPMNLVFERAWGNAGGSALAIGPDESVYVAGFTVVGEYPLQDTDATLLRFDADGRLLWGRSWRGFADEVAEGVAVDATGAAYLTGMTTSFGTEAFVLKFAPQGDLLWQRTWGGASEDGGEAVAVGPGGAVYVAGFTQSFGEFPGAITFLLRFSSEGDLVWERTWETSSGGLPTDLAVSPDGSIYVGGLAYPRGFLAKFVPDGTLAWDRTYLAHDFTDFEGVGATPDGGVVAVGQWMPSFDQQVLVTRFSADGELLSARTWGGESHEVASDAAVAPDGTTYVVGETDTFSSGVYDDFFILRMLPDGRVREARTWGGPFQDTATGAAFGSGGDLYVVGTIGPSPFTFGSAPSQTFRVRNASLADPEAIVGTPAGSLGTPDGEAHDFEPTAPSVAGGGALLRIRTT